jgi:hypothetical protein
MGISNAEFVDESTLRPIGRLELGEAMTVILIESLFLRLETLAGVKLTGNAKFDSNRRSEYELFVAESSIVPVCVFSPGVTVSVWL